MKGHSYENTTHGISSAIIKLSKLTKACDAYRDLSNNTLPAAFWTPNTFDVSGGVNMAVSYTTVNRWQARQYAKGKASTTLEMQPGIFDRSPEVSWLSQYTHDFVILFPLLLGIQVFGSHIAGHGLCHPRASITEFDIRDFGPGPAQLSRQCATRQRKSRRRPIFLGRCFLFHHLQICLVIFQDAVRHSVQCNHLGEDTREALVERR